MSQHFETGDLAVMDCLKDAGRKEVGATTPQNLLGPIVDFAWSPQEEACFNRYCEEAQIVDATERRAAEEDYKLSKHLPGRVVILQPLPDGGRAVLAFSGGDERRFSELREQMFSSRSGELELRNVISEEA